jgi:rhodanese-related sulfurtransferase
MSRQEVLVDADWVAEHGTDENVVLIEVDEDTTAYDGGHIAGAIKLDWRTDLQDPIRRDFVNKEQFEKLLSERGVGNDDTVVLYGGNNNWFAAYAYWYFKLYGHQKALLLDGGRKKWEAEKRPLDTRNVQLAPSRFTAAERSTALRARLAERFTLSDLPLRTGGPARYVHVAETGGRLGFITPMTHNFCEGCNRVRVTCTGTLYTCLGQEDHADLRAALRGSESDDALDAAISEAIRVKPRGHDFVIDRAGRAPAVPRHMSVTGG